jgi:tetratricopeptide (TPR) repeat protein
LVPQGNAHHELGQIFLGEGDDALAIRHFEADLAIEPACQDSRGNLAALHLQAGRYDQARDQYEQSLYYHPDDARALSGLGRAYLALGDYERAIGALRSASDLSPDDEDVKEALASARWKLKIRYGIPWAIAPTAVALGLIVYVVMQRRRRKEAT